MHAGAVYICPTHSLTTVDGSWTITPPWMTTHNDSHNLQRAKALTKNLTYVLTLTGAFFLALYGVSVGLSECSLTMFLKVVGTGGILSCSAFVVGSLLGFLFGIPKGPEKQSENRPWVVNTNLVQISDWLTKMLVGLSLAVLFQVPGHLNRFGTYFGADLGSRPLAVLLLVYYSFTGFLAGYLMTRLFLQQAFHEADLAPEAKGHPELGSEPSELSSNPTPGGKTNPSLTKATSSPSEDEE